MLTYKVLEDLLGQRNTSMCLQLSLDLQSNTKSFKQAKKRKNHNKTTCIKEMKSLMFIHLGNMDLISSCAGVKACVGMGVG